jgi:hypothetical protein
MTGFADQGVLDMDATIWLDGPRIALKLHFGLMELNSTKSTYESTKNSSQSWQSYCQLKWVCQILDNPQKYVCKDIKVSNWSYAQIIFTTGFAGQGILNIDAAVWYDSPKSTYESTKNSPQSLQSYWQLKWVCQIFGKKGIFNVKKTFFIKSICESQKFNQLSTYENFANVNWTFRLENESDASFGP